MCLVDELLTILQILQTNPWFCCFKPMIGYVFNCNHVGTPSSQNSTLQNVSHLNQPMSLANKFKDKSNWLAWSMIVQDIWDTILFHSRAPSPVLMGNRTSWLPNLYPSPEKLGVRFWEEKAMISFCISSFKAQTLLFYSLLHSMTLLSLLYLE